jgi:iron-sulfur cluster repair protein YtfE (RIC family)
MDKTTYRQEVQRVAKTDHRLQSLEIETCRRIFIEDTSSKDVQRFAVLQTLIMLKMVQHFRDEEDRVFPALLAISQSDKATQLIIELVREHEQLLLGAQDLNRLFVHSDINECKGELWVEMLDFLDHMQKHVAKEEKLFELFLPEMPSSPPTPSVEAQMSA